MRIDAAGAVLALEARRNSASAPENSGALTLSATVVDSGAVAGAIL